jgi:UDP-N-acetylglucosamine transferase subunit ALG13
MKFVRMLAPDAFGAMVKDAEIVVAHAGMGSAIQSAETGTPVVLLPRLAERREHTTDHQLHTARWLKERPGIFVAMDEGELDARIVEARSARRSGATLGKTAPAEFTARIRQALLS